MKYVRTVKLGQSVLIADHPRMPSLIGKTGKVVDFGFGYRDQEFTGHEGNDRRLWVRLDGIEGLEYGVPFNCLHFASDDDVA